MSPEKKATVKDVAAEAGVSVATVSFVINGKAGVRPGTRAKVLDTIHRLGYVPNDAAVRLVSGKSSYARAQTGRFAFVVAHTTEGGLAHPIIARILNGVTAELDRHGYFLSSHIIHTDLLSGDVFPKALRPGTVDGIIFAGGNPGGLVRLARTANLPIVLAETTCEEEAVDAVVLDNVQASYAAVSLLFEHGHERIGLILDARPTSNLTPPRFQGYLTAHMSAGVPVSPDRIVDSILDYESGRNAMRELLSRSPRVTAVFAMNDYTALGALHEAQAQEVDVPGEISIVGFDDIDMASQVYPGLTTVRAPAEDIGRAAARRLCEILSEHDNTPRRQFFFGEVVCRGTVRRIGEPVRRPPLSGPVTDAAGIRRFLQEEET